MASVCHLEFKNLNLVAVIKCTKFHHNRIIFTEDFHISGHPPSWICNDVITQHPVIDFHCLRFFTLNGLPVFLQSSHIRDWQTDRQTDKQISSSFKAPFPLCGRRLNKYTALEKKRVSILHCAGSVGLIINRSVHWQDAWPNAQPSCRRRPVDDRIQYSTQYCISAEHLTLISHGLLSTVRSDHSLTSRSLHTPRLFVRVTKLHEPDKSKRLTCSV